MTIYNYVTKIVDLYCKTCGRKGLEVVLSRTSEYSTQATSEDDFYHRYSGKCLSCDRITCCIEPSDIEDIT